MGGLGWGRGGARRPRAGPPAPARWFPCLAAVAFVALGWLATALPAAAQEGGEPARCTVGAYLTAIHDLDIAADTFQADLWLWSVCPTADRNPLATMEFVNADETEASLQQDAQRGTAYWATQKIRGTFRHDWDVRSFPFDRQTLTIVMEKGDDDATAFVYEPDTRETAYDARMEIPGWQITRFELVPSLATYDTTFGDPDLGDGSSSRYSRLTLRIGIERTELSSFFKLTAVVYAAFVFSLITYFMHLENVRALSPQMNLLSAALFAAAINMLTAGSILGDVGGLSLIDAIHITVLVAILAATIFAVVSRLLLERGWSEEAIARLNRRAFAVALVAFVVVNAAMILLARRAG